MTSWQGEEKEIQAVEKEWMLKNRREQEQEQEQEQGGSLVKKVI